MRVEAGICGLDTEFVMQDDNDTLVISARSECAKVMDLASRVSGCDTMLIALTPLPDNPVVKQAGKCGLHSGCPVPCAFIKAAEICGGLALPADVVIVLGRADDGA